MQPPDATARCNRQMQPPDATARCHRHATTTRLPRMHRVRDGAAASHREGLSATQPRVRARRGYLEARGVRKDGTARVRDPRPARLLGRATTAALNSSRALRPHLRASCAGTCPLPRPSRPSTATSTLRRTRPGRGCRLWSMGRGGAARRQRSRTGSCTTSGRASPSAILWAPARRTPQTTSCYCAGCSSSCSVASISSQAPLTGASCQATRTLWSSCCPSGSPSARRFSTATCNGHACNGHVQRPRATATCNGHVQRPRVQRPRMHGCA